MRASSQPCAFLACWRWRAPPAAAADDDDDDDDGERDLPAAAVRGWAASESRGAGVRLSLACVSKKKKRPRV